MGFKELTHQELLLLFDILFDEIKQRFGEKIYDEIMRSTDQKIEFLQKYLIKG